MITLQDVKNAQILLTGASARTPILGFPALDERYGLEVLVKAESLNRTGCFKVRGITNVVRHLSGEEKARGLITISAGNTAKALAYVAREEGLKAVVVMTDFVRESKLKAVQRYGAETILAPSPELPARCRALVEEHDYVMVHPHTNPHMMAGNGTAGLEIVEDYPDVDAVIVPVGGAGLISGVAVAVKETNPKAKVFGVQSANVAAMCESLRRGECVTIEPKPTMAEALAAPWALPEPFAVVQRYVDDVVAVDEDEIEAAYELIKETTFLPVEPGAAVGFAALDAGKIRLPSGSRVAVVLSGGNE